MKETIWEMFEIFSSFFGVFDSAIQSFNLDFLIIRQIKMIKLISKIDKISVNSSFTNYLYNVCHDQMYAYVNVRQNVALDFWRNLVV